MAIIHGKSGAERDLLELSKEHGFRFQDIRDIKDTKAGLKEELFEREAEVTKEIKEEIERLKANSNEIKSSIEKKSEEIREDIKLEMEKIKEEVKSLKSGTGIAKIFTSFINPIKKWRGNRRYRYLKNNPEKETRKRLKPVYEEHSKAEKRLNFLEENFQEEINRRLVPLKDKFDRIGRITGSKEFKGATGEVEVVGHLEKLSDNFHVFNDHTVESKKWIEIKGTKRKTAQLDHVVVGPTGVYVIETKNWSKASIEKSFAENKHTPYDQVESARILLYRELNGCRYGNIFQKIYFRFANREIKVRAIIAVSGSKLPLEEKRFTKVLFPEGIPDYIQNGNYRLPKKRASEVINKLSKR